ncbi:Charged multivesicular body protein 7 [Schistosoma japonicum]|nr:Charged multivesicular body protein 7 [Schistosoma japonicum]
MVENKLIGFCLPDIWDDDDAMYSLMQPIRRSKVVDPVNYNAKITFWKRILLSYAKNHKTFIICKQSLQKLFTRHFPVEGIDLYPQSLGEVISDLISEGLLEAVTPNKGILGSIFTTFSYIVHKPISWVYQYVNGQLHDSVETNTLDGQFVFSQFAEDSAVEFLSWFHDNYRDQSLLPNLSVYDLEIFSSALSSFYSHTASREYIFDLLNNNKHCVSVETISTLDSKPIQSLLRRTKTLEKSLEQKQLQLHNLETMLVDIESATENRNIVRVLSNVNEALKQAVGGSDALSQAEGVVNDVMDKIQESQEISDVVASFGLTSSGLEEMSDLEQELGRLLAAPRKTQPSFDDLEAELSALTLVTDKTDSSPDQNPVISKRKPVIISE